MDLLGILAPGAVPEQNQRRDERRHDDDEDDAGDPLIAPDSIGIVVRRAVVMEPDCGTEEPILPGVRPEFRVGCSTAYNLGAMVAYPEDLIEGRGLSPADGTKGATSIDRYRKDKVKDIDKERTSDL